ncbi:MFS transporter [Streptomyces sp. NPDC005727]|uniref:MFS transporter n=1 Tax=Streptomyces sp. NPDC005727 TaxID=3157053 RepID=UPI0033C382D0
MILANLINAFGTGLYQTVSAMYLTRSVGLTAAEVGLGISVGAAAAVVAGPPLGRTADRKGPRDLLVVTFLVQWTVRSALRSCMGSPSSWLSQS